MVLKSKIKQGLLAQGTSVLILFIVAANTNLYGQKDTITYTVENSYDSIDHKYHHIYSLFIADKVKDTKQLWKTNLLDVSLLLPSIVYERKIGKSFSVESYLKIGVKNSNYLGDAPLKEQFVVIGKLEQSFKYYYNLKRRENLGKRITGFTGNYFAVSAYFDGGVGSFSYRQDSLYESKRYDIGLQCKYGLQRRLGNIGYIEPSIGMGYNWEKRKSYLAGNPYYYQFHKGFLFTMDIQIGFAIGSFKNLKRKKY